MRRQSVARRDRKTSALHWKVTRPSGSRSQLCRLGVTSSRHTVWGREEDEGAPRTLPCPAPSSAQYSRGSAGWGAGRGRHRPGSGGRCPRGILSAAYTATCESRTAAPRRGPRSNSPAPRPACTMRGRGAPAAGTAPGRRPPTSRAWPWGRGWQRAAERGRAAPVLYLLWGRGGRAVGEKPRLGASEAPGLGAGATPSSSPSPPVRPPPRLPGVWSCWSGWEAAPWPGGSGLSGSRASGATLSAQAGRGGHSPQQAGEPLTSQFPPSRGTEEDQGSWRRRCGGVSGAALKFTLRREGSATGKVLGAGGRTRRVVLRGELLHRG